MDYWFPFVLIVLLPCCVHSRETPETEVLKYKLHVITKNLSREHEFVSILEPEVAGELLKNVFETGMIHLHRINERLDKVKARMRPNSTQFDVKLEAAVEALNVYLENISDNVKRDLFLKACWNASIRNTVRKLRKITKVNSKLLLNDTVERMSELGDFVIHTNFLILTTIKETIVSEACLRAFLEKKVGIDHVFAIYRNKTRLELLKLVSVLKNKYLALENGIDGTQEVKDYVGDYQLGHRHQNAQVFVDTVYEQLTEKYFWRNWLVVSFRERKSYETLGDVKVNSDYSFFLDRGYNRSIYVASPDRVHEDAFTGNIDVCFGKSQTPPSCGTALFLCFCYAQIKEFFNCQDPMEVKGVVCVWNGVNMKFKGGTSGYKVYSLTMPQDYLGVHVNKTLMAEIGHDFIVVL